MLFTIKRQIAIMYKSICYKYKNFLTMAIRNLLLCYHEPLCSVETNLHTFGVFMIYDEFDNWYYLCTFTFDLFYYSNGLLCLMGCDYALNRFKSNWNMLEWLKYTYSQIKSKCDFIISSLDIIYPFISISQRVLPIIFI